MVKCCKRHLDLARCGCNRGWRGGAALACLGDNFVTQAGFRMRVRILVARLYSDTQLDCNFLKWLPN